MLSTLSNTIQNMSIFTAKLVNHICFFSELFGDSETAHKILQTADPKEHKKLGRQVKNFDQKIWDKKCIRIVKRGNKAKVSYLFY